MEYTFIDRLKKILKNKNIKQKKFCEDIGISQQSIYEWQNKHSYPNGELIIRIANYLNVSCDYLLTGQEGEKNATHEQIKSALQDVMDML